MATPEDNKKRTTPSPQDPVLAVGSGLPPVAGSLARTPTFQEASQRVRIAGGPTYDQSLMQRETQKSVLQPTPKVDVTQALGVVGKPVSRPAGGTIAFSEPQPREAFGVGAALQNYQASSNNPVTPATTPAVPPVAPTAAAGAPTVQSMLDDQNRGTDFGTAGANKLGTIYRDGNTFTDDPNAGGQVYTPKGNLTVMDTKGLRESPYYKQAVAELSGQGLPQVAPQNQVITIGQNGGFGFDKKDPATARAELAQRNAEMAAGRAGIGQATPKMIEAEIAKLQANDQVANAQLAADTSRANKQDDMTLGREGLTSEEDRAQAKAITDMLLRQDANANALQVAGLGNIGKVTAAQVGQESKGIPKPMVTTNAQGQPDVFVPVMNSETGGYEFVLQSEMNARRKQAQEQKQ